jgi:hypothetical protein
MSALNIQDSKLASRARASGARPIKMNSRFIKQNFIFEESLGFYGPIKKI